MPFDNMSPGSNNSQNREVRSRGGGLKWLILVIVLVLVGAGWQFYGKKFFSSENKNTLQAVFLTNGQVYFGKLETKSDWLVLSGVYYLEAKPALQSGDTAAIADQNNVQLVKLGGELHGPEDQMFIESKNVLFWENMKADSKVMEAIAKHKDSL